MQKGRSAAQQPPAMIFVEFCLSEGDGCGLPTLDELINSQPRAKRQRSKRKRQAAQASGRRLHSDQG